MIKTAAIDTISRAIAGTGAFPAIFAVHFFGRSVAPMMPIIKKRITDGVTVVDRKVSISGFIVHPANILPIIEKPRPIESARKITNAVTATRSVYTLPSAMNFHFSGSLRFAPA